VRDLPALDLGNGSRGGRLPLPPWTDGRQKWSARPLLPFLRRLSEGRGPFTRPRPSRFAGADFVAMPSGAAWGAAWSASCMAPRAGDADGRLQTQCPHAGEVFRDEFSQPFEDKSPGRWSH
jgi:hypothetical protein